MKQPSILWLTENYFPQNGGMAESCDRIVSSLRRGGAYVDVGFISSRAPELRTLRKLNGHDLMVPVLAGLPHALNRLWNAISCLHRDRPYTHLVAFGGSAPIVAAPVFRQWLNVPAIVCLRGNDFDTAIFTPSRRSVLDDALTSADAMVVLTEEHRLKVESRYPAVPTEVIPNGICLDSWRPLDSDRKRAAALRESFDAKKRVVGVFGHLKAKKGLEFFMRTAASLPEADRPHILLVGELEQDLLQRFPQLSTTHFPFRDRYELIPLYLSCDCIAVPSHYDGFPNVLLEAAGLGLPIVASAVGGMKDFLAPFPQFMFHPESRPECRAVLQRLTDAAHSELCSYGSALRERVASCYTMRSEYEAYRKIIHRLGAVDETPSPPQDRHQSHGWENRIL